MSTARFSAARLVELRLTSGDVEKRVKRVNLAEREPLLQRRLKVHVTIRPKRIDEALGALAERVHSAYVFWTIAKGSRYALRQLAVPGRVLEIIRLRRIMREVRIVVQRRLVVLEAQQVKVALHFF